MLQTKKYIRMKQVPFLLLLIGIIACGQAGDRHPSDFPVKDTGLKWIDYRIGELPPAGYYDAFDSIIRKWDLRFERIEGGCTGTVAEREHYEKGNSAYFKLLEQQLGKDWRTRFDREVTTLDSLLRLKMVNDPLITGASVQNLPAARLECADKGGNMEEGFVKECSCRSCSLEQAYQAFRQQNSDNDDGRYLEQQLPVKDKTYDKKNKEVTVTYHYRDKGVLTIELGFAGGVTTITFSVKNDDVIISTNYSPD